MTPAELAARLKEEGLAPAVAAGCSVRGSGSWRRDFGGDIATFFDLASLTKPMTAVALARLGMAIAARRLADVCPELSDTSSRDATIALLLSHRAGLVAHIPIYLPLVTGGVVDPQGALRRAANERREEARGGYPAGGFAPVYSDLGYALAGVMLARLMGHEDAGAAIGDGVVKPLGLERSLGTHRELSTLGIPVDELAAPTEVVAWRGGAVRGLVHDENAWALTKTGGSGHAGMFGTVSAVLRFGEAVLDALDGGGELAGEPLGWLVEERPGGTLRAGFDGKSPEGSSAGRLFGPRSFGHLGFTGTSLWVDPDAKVVAVLLTNRVYPSRDRAHDAIRAARPIAHDALFAHARDLAR